MRAARTTKAQVFPRADLGGISGPAMASVLFSRLVIFWPSIKGVPERQWETTTPWGYISVKGKLSQIHRSILDAMFSHAITSRRNEDGTASLTIDPYQIATEAGVSRNRKWFLARLTDMRLATVRVLESGDTTPHEGGIVSEWQPTKETVPLPGGALTGEMPLIRVTISAAWMRIFDETLAVRYKPLVRKIGALESGAAQALVRFILTHTEAHFRLDEALKWIGALRDEPEMSRSQRYRVIAEIRAVEGTLTRDFGIRIEDDVIHYDQHPRVRFASPDQQEVGV